MLSLKTITTVCFFLWAVCFLIWVFSHVSFTVGGLRVFASLPFRTPTVVYDVKQDVGEVKSAAVEAHRKLKREENARVLCIEVSSRRKTLSAIVVVAVQVAIAVILPPLFSSSSHCGYGSCS